MPRTFVVTGASSGVGAAVVEALAARGENVVPAVRSPEAATSLRARFQPLVFDVTDERAVEAAVASLGEVHGLVNSAGVAALGPMEWTGTATLRSLLETNVVGVHVVTRALMPRLRASRGRLVNVSSMSGLLAPPFAGAYAASKFALEAMSDAWRLELTPHGVHVALIEPSALATRIWQRMVDALPTLGGTAPYPEWETARTVLRNIGQNAGPLKSVVADVVHALTDAAPRTRYAAEPLENVNRLRAMDDGERDALLRKGWGLGG
ncbi:MAG: SDR family NAD(P)-dependent oxidoreductase [Archangium sp.]